MVGAKGSTLLLVYGLTQESQFRLLEQLGPHFSSTLSFEAVYKAILVGHGTQLQPPNPAFQLEYRNGLRTGEA